MNPLEIIGLALGTGFSSGLNLYATVATLGLLQRFGVIHLPESMRGLAHPWVIGIAGVLYFIEFFADKIPYVDTIWDAVHTFIRPPAALPRRSGAGERPCWRELWRSRRTAQKPARARPPMSVPNRSAIGH